MRVLLFCFQHSKPLPHPFLNRCFCSHFSINVAVVLVVFIFPQHSYFVCEPHRQRHARLVDLYSTCMYVSMFLCLFVCMCACLYADNTFLNPFFVFSSHLLTLLIPLLLYPCYSFLLHIPQLVGCLPLLLLLVKIGLRSTIFASNVGNVDKLHSEMQKQ